MYIHSNIIIPQILTALSAVLYTDFLLICNCIMIEFFCFFHNYVFVDALEKKKASNFYRMKSSPLLIWSMAPAQNLPKNFLAPRFLRSVIRNGHRWRTLLREKLSRFSSSTTLQPSKAASIAVLSPQGPAPITSTCTCITEKTYKTCTHWKNL